MGGRTIIPAVHVSRASRCIDSNLPTAGVHQIHHLLGPQQCARPAARFHAAGCVAAFSGEDETAVGRCRRKWTFPGSRYRRVRRRFGARGRRRGPVMTGRSAVVAFQRKRQTEEAPWSTASASETTH